MPTPDLQAIADAVDASESATLFLDQALDDAARKALLDDYQLHSELDSVRGVDAVRDATDEEIAESVAAPAAKTASAPKSGTSTST